MVWSGVVWCDVGWIPFEYRSGTRCIPFECVLDIHRILFAYMLDTYWISLEIVCGHVTPFGYSLEAHEPPEARGDSTIFESLGVHIEPAAFPNCHISISSLPDGKICAAAAMIM